MSRTLRQPGQYSDADLKFAHSPETPSDGDDATITVPGVSGEYHVGAHLWFSISGNPSSARNLTIKYGEDRLKTLDQYITTGGVGPIPLHGMNGGVAGEKMTVHVPGVAGVTIKLTLAYW